MGQSTTWKETCIEFKKCTDCKFWADMHKSYWDFCPIRTISL